jgi:peptide-methionine (S)-S-oxide reductase
MKSLFRRYSRLLLVCAMASVGSAVALGDVAAAEKTDTLVVAGGCFWCVESDFDHVPGVIDTVSGYTGGTTENPTYQAVSAGGTGHLEAVKITFDPNKVSYQELLDIFWRTVDPTDSGGQFCDRGESYTTAIFATTPQQRQSAEISKRLTDASGILENPIVTPILDASTFYPSEDYHQDYSTKNPIRYSFYRLSCGRDKQVRAIWGDEAYRGVDEH